MCALLESVSTLFHLDAAARRWLIAEEIQLFNWAFKYSSGSLGILCKCRSFRQSATIDCDPMALSRHYLTMIAFEPTATEQKSINEERKKTDK